MVLGVLWLFSLLPLTLQQDSKQTDYTLIPNKIGVSVYNLDLTTDLAPDIVKSIVRDTYRHKIMVFKNQSHISAKTHLKISKWFGDNVDGTHRKHPKQEDPYVFRVSEEEKKR